MARELIVRLAAIIPTMLVAGVFVFFLFRLLPDDYVDTMLSQAAGIPNPDVAAAMRAQYGLDRSVGEQFVAWLTATLRGDLGTSLRTGKPVANELLNALPATIELSIGALVISLGLALPVAVISAVRRNSWLDLGIRFVSLMGSAVPNFWLAILAIYAFAVVLHLLPATGFVPLLVDPFQNLRSAILPVLSLGVPLAGTLVRQIRAQLLEVLALDYVRTARAKGLRERAVLYRHALRNSLIPVVTILGLRLGGLLSGALITEVIFRWPGVGRVVFDSIAARDYPTVLGGVLMFTFVYLMSNLTVDVLYTYLDPRLRRI